MAPPTVTPRNDHQFVNFSTHDSTSLSDQHVVINEDKERTSSKAMLISYAVAFPMTMHAAVELGLLDIIAKMEKQVGPVTAAEVVSELPTENPMAASMVERMLYLLAAFSIVSCSVETGKGKVFGMTPVGKYFVKDENEGVSLGPLISLVQGEVAMNSWFKLKDAVLEGGIPFSRAHTMSAFEYAETDPRFSETFNTAMFNHSTIVMRDILESYKGFDSINQLADVGGSVGHNLKMILSKYPHIKGINFDLPHVTVNGISHPGMEHVSGDMFKSVPHTDAIFMKWILHDWNDEDCLKLLRNCHKALPQNGKVVVVEGVLSEVFEKTTAEKVLCGMDIMMMVHTPGGKERTKKEFLNLSQTAGFTHITFEAYACGFWIMEFHK